MTLAVANGWDAVIAVAQLVGTVITAFLVNHNRRALRVPSGGTVGRRLERVHELAAVLVKRDHDVDGPVQKNGADT